MTDSMPRVRRRITFACEMCRSRRTKCDGRKPACSFCESHGIQCTYASAVPPLSSRNDAESSAVKERLDHLCGLLSIKLVGQEARIFEKPPGSLPELPPLRDYPLDESVISRHWRREFPFMSIQTPSMMCLLELSPRLAAQLVARERTEVPILPTPSDPPGFLIHYEDAIRAFGAFHESIQHWYPVLSPEFFNLYREKITSLLVPSSGSCLVLLVAAIGSIVQCQSLTAAYEKRPDSRYISKALCMLPNVLSEFSLSSVQCLVLFSVYYCVLVKPCQAHDYILMASSKAQAILKCRIFENDEIQSEILRRSFWSILLLESELGYHIDMPESNIWKFDDRILLPGTLTSWEPYHEDQKSSFDNIQLPHRFGMSAGTAQAYFLAQIAICRMVRRCTMSVVISQEQETFSVVIAIELTYQLDTWYTHLPPNIRFELQDTTTDISHDFLKNVSSFSSSGVMAISQFLQMQYHLCVTGIYWPAVYSVISKESLNTVPPAYCTRFFEAYIGFVMTAASVVPRCPQNPWSIYASLFITTMACFKGANNTLLRPNVPQNVFRCFSIAAEMFKAGEAVTVSPALGKLGLILRERVTGII